MQMEAPLQVARRSDMDMNGHINNVTYLSWALETVPKHIAESCTLHQVRHCWLLDIVQIRKRVVAWGVPGHTHMTTVHQQLRLWTAGVPRLTMLQLLAAVQPCVRRLPACQAVLHRAWPPSLALRTCVSWLSPQCTRAGCPAASPRASW